MTLIDSLVDSYLRAVAQAAADLPPQHREDLLTDLREHITTARAELNPETEAGVRTILDRLGDPASIAAEARRDKPPHPAPLPAANAHVPPHRSRSWVWVVVALVLGVPLAACVVGALVFFAARTTSEDRGPVPVSSPITQPNHTGQESHSLGATR
jgi:uncharacterized membrane protein